MNPQKLSDLFKIIMAHNLSAPSTSKTQNTAYKNEYLYKILVIGELGSGKTAIIKVGSLKVA